MNYTIIAIMDVLPRLKLDHQTDLKATPASAKQDESSKKDEPKKDENKKEDKGIMSSLRENAPVVFLFGIVIIGLLILVAYLVTKNDSYFSWFKGNKTEVPSDNKGNPTTALMNAAKKKVNNKSHSDIVAGVSDDELAQYTSKAKETKETKEEKEPPKPATVAITIEEEKKVTFGADHVISIDEIDNDMERELNQRMNGETINSVIEDSLRKMAAEFRKISQLDDNGAVIKTFDTADQLISGGFGIDEVVKCCTDPTKMYKKFKWKYAA